MTVSVVICTCDRPGDLRETLAALERVERPPALACELVVVDNGPRGDAAEVVRAFADGGGMPARYVREARRGLARARNAGLAESAGDFLLFTDDDVRPGPAWIAGMCALLLSGSCQAVAGGVRLAPGLERPWMRPVHKELLASTEGLGGGPPNTMVGANMAFSREVLARVPLFDPALGAGTAYGGEESLFTFQLREAGFTVAPAYDMAVEHHFDPSRLLRAAFLERTRREGRGLAYLAYHWEHRDFRLFALRYVKNRLRLAALRLRRRASLTAEGMPEWEMTLLRGVCFYRQYLIERTRPRNYDRRGLVKCRGLRE